MDVIISPLSPLETNDKTESKSCSNPSQTDESNNKSSIVSTDQSQSTHNTSPSKPPNNTMYYPTYHSVIAGMQHSCGILNSPEYQPDILYTFPSIIKFVCFGNNNYNQIDIPVSLLSLTTNVTLLASGL